MARMCRRLGHVWAVSPGANDHQRHGDQAMVPQKPSGSHRHASAYYPMYPMLNSGPDLVFKSRWMHSCSSLETNYEGWRDFLPDMRRLCLPPWSIGKNANGTLPFWFKRTTLLSRRFRWTYQGFRVHTVVSIFSTQRPCASTRLASMGSNGGSRYR